MRVDVELRPLFLVVGDVMSADDGQMSPSGGQKLYLHSYNINSGLLNKCPTG